MEHNVATIEGYVEKIVYRNEENGYTVLSVTVEDDEITKFYYYQEFSIKSAGRTISSTFSYSVTFE